MWLLHFAPGARLRARPLEALAGCALALLYHLLCHSAPRAASLQLQRVEALFAQARAPATT